MNGSRTKISIDSATALIEFKDFERSNTKVHVFEYGNCIEANMYLFDNMIARYVSDELGRITLQITNAGWDTVTTKDRLNAIPDVRIHQKNYNWYLNDELWDGEWITVKENDRLMVNSINTN